MGFQAFWVLHGWIVNSGILLHPVHCLLRVDRTSKKGGEKMKEKIKMHI